MSDADFLRKSLFTVSGLLIWALHFALLYGLAAVACARGWQEHRFLGFGLIPFSTAALTLAALMAAAATLLAGIRRYAAAEQAHDIRPVDAFMAYTAATLAAVSLVAILWNAVPVFIVPVCR